MMLPTSSTKLLAEHMATAEERAREEGRLDFVDRLDQSDLWGACRRWRRL